jgi:hypothetical protein
MKVISTLESHPAGKISTNPTGYAEYFLANGLICSTSYEFINAKMFRVIKCLTLLSSEHPDY